MAAVNITIRGMFYDPYTRVYYPNAVMVGEAFLTDYSVGGGPIIPPQQPPGGGRPPGTIWPNPPEGIAPHPEHPIVLPSPPDKPPEPVQPPIEWKAVWHPTEGWIVVGIPNLPHPTPSS